MSLTDATAALLSARDIELSRLQQESETLKASISMKEANLASLESELNRLKTKKDKGFQRDRELEAAKAECARRLEDMREWAEKQLEALEKEKDEERETMKKELESLRTQNDKMLAEIQDPLKTKTEELYSQKEQLERANTELEARLSTIQAEHAQKLMRLRSQLSDTMEEAESLRESVAATQTRLRRTTRDSGSLLTRTTRQQHSQQVAQRACLVTQAQDLEQQLEHALKESEANVSNALKELEEIRRMCNTAEEEAQHLEEEARKIEAVNKEADAVITRQEVELERLGKLIRTETNTRERLRLELERLDRVLSFTVRTTSPIITEASRKMNMSLSGY